jgi:4-diphosphocytidyl-2-C-methyl-D-erythritol kinase
MTLRSFAKINLGLEIVGKRPDGYHDIRTLFQTISLADELDFEPAPTGTLDLAGDDPTILWDATNLVHRAARLLQERTGTAKGAKIVVRKRIPAGRGLGGGSSNAAVTLLTLNRMWGLGLGTGELAGLARSRCPLFSEGGSMPRGGDRGQADASLRHRPPAVPAHLPAFPHPHAVHLRGRRPVLDFPGQSQ